MDKATLRKQLTRCLAPVGDAELALASRIVTERLKNAVDWRAIRSVHIYSAAPKWREIDVAKLSVWLMHNNPELEVTSAPPRATAPIPGDDFDVIIVPLLGFDAACLRLGRGAGWYDRFLARQPQAIKIGVGFDVQRVDAVPMEPHDIPLDAVVTEGTTYRRQISTL